MPFILHASNSPSIAYANDTAVALTARVVYLVRVYSLSIAHVNDTGVALTPRVVYLVRVEQSFHSICQ